MGCSLGRISSNDPAGWARTRCPHLSSNIVRVTVDYYTGTPFPWETVLGISIILIPTMIIIYMAIKHRATIHLNVQQTSQGTIITTSVVHKDEQRLTLSSERICRYCGVRFEGNACPKCHMAQ
jgi:hypothetical protein